MKLTNDLYVYETPQVEVIEVEVEKGFSLSEGTGSTGSFT